jgi:uncharacterized membrane protein YecN with MAPEG domain
MRILPAYAALFALIFVYLSLRTIGLRRRLQIAVGDAGNPLMLRAMRVHANFAEYVPFALLLIFLVESQGARAGLVHGLCLTLLIGRVLHAWGLSQARENFRFRVIGMVLTFATLVSAALYLLIVTL